MPSKDVLLKIIIYSFLTFQHLMTSENSPIIEYYPLDFKTDLNGKQQEWEAVVLIPFIDEVHAPRQEKIPTINSSEGTLISGF